MSLIWYGVGSVCKGVMLEIFQNFEQMTARFSPWVLIVPGVAALLVGLLIWLGGLSLGKLFVAIAGAASGFIVGLFVIGRNAFSALLSAAVATVIAIIFEKVIIIVLAAILAAAICFAFLAGPYIELSQAQTSAAPNDLPAQAATPGVRGSVEQLKAYALDVGGKIKQAGSQMPAQKWAVIAVPAAIIIVGGLTLRRLTSALYFSVQGTLFIFAGMILLLLYKGTRPVSHIRINPSIYASVFAAMTAFGTVEQLLICKRTKTGSAGGKNAGGNKNGRSKN